MAAPRAISTLIEKLSFPEGLRWRGDTLWCSDILGHRVLKIDADGRVAEAARLADRPSGLGFLPDGTPLVVSMTDRTLLAISRDGTLRVHADLRKLSGHFINDMVVDRNGRAYIGSRNGGGPAAASDSIIMVEAYGQARVVAEGMVSPNGSVVTPDGKFLIVAETALGRLTRFRIGAGGDLSHRETLAELPGRHIDGICMDTQGAFWCGGGESGALHIGADGKLLDLIEQPGRMVLATALGGEDGRTLFLATTGVVLIDILREIGFDRARDATVDPQGRIDLTNVSVPGIGCP
ncbi:MAG TPA: SMP-30/gluconolactonase/LRE family protein [Alphaproteobacteria bacterium]|nr:SMP-30/gluconolactonase/LRE family protein [Alphaproteobacteria bacterium]